MASQFEIKEIPPLQDIVVKIINYDLDNETSGSTELLNILTPDKGICSKILKVSNSAFYASSRQITNLNDAIVRLGLRTVRMLVIASMSNSMKKILQKKIFMKYIQDYPTTTAYVAVDLLKHIKNKKIQKYKVKVWKICIFDDKRYSCNNAKDIIQFFDSLEIIK